jgi:hypothetical protein
MFDKINEIWTIIKFMPSNKFLTSGYSKKIILMNKIRYFSHIYSKSDPQRVESDGGLPRELGSRDWCHWIQLTKHS